MSAETGVGPAMASGSQVCSGNWPGLRGDAGEEAQAADEQQRRGWRRSDRAYSLMCRMSKLVAPAAKKVMMTPRIRPTSPTRLVRKALRAASLFFFSSHQCPMSANEQRPTSSQPTSICRVLELMT